MPEWVTRWRYELSAKAVRPGIWRLRDGGFFVRGRFRDAMGKRKDVKAALREAKTPAEAQRTLDALVAQARAQATGAIPSSQPWGSFALSCLKERALKRKLESESTIERWTKTLENILIPAFGNIDARDTKTLRFHIDSWLTETVAKWMKEGKPVVKKRRGSGESRRSRGPLEDKIVLVKIKPTTVNGWLRILRTICRAAKVKFDLPKSAFEGIEFFGEGRLFTKEQPNALPPDLMPIFMATARFMYPQHYAMILLGFVTGLRPSSIRPLRRKGPEADIDWNTGMLQIRRSHSRKQTIMNKTKIGTDGEIALPSVVLEVMKWHVATQLSTPGQRESDLLFPNEDGGLRARNVLEKPFKAIAKELGLKIKLTPKGMRRTFNDMARVAGVHDVVTRSISGHQTEKMQHHYSTALAKEQRAELEKVHAMIEGKDAAE